MRLLICFKITSDLDAIRPEEYIVTESNSIDTSYVAPICNCYDESSLEFGLRIRDERSEESLLTSLTAFTVGGKETGKYIKTLIALKYDKVVHIDSMGEDIRFAPERISDEICSFHLNNPQDFIILGRQAPEGSNFATAQMLAHKCKLPLVSNIVDIHHHEEGMRVHIEVDGSTYEQVIKPPAVLSMGNAIVSCLRVPTLKDRMEYGKREAVVSEIKENNEQTYSPLLQAKDQSRHARKILGDNSKETLSLLFGYLEEMGLIK